MSAAHTPGPWLVSAVLATEVIGPKMSAVCRMVSDYPNRTVDENRANARLIAAAPELLEALKRLCSFDPVPTQDDWDDARVIIAKAEGRQ